MNWSFTGSKQAALSNPPAATDGGEEHENQTDVSSGIQNMSLTGQRPAPANTRRTTYNKEPEVVNKQTEEDAERPYDMSQKDGKVDTLNYDAQRMIGHGSFGAVFLAKVVETDEVVAIKKVLQDRRFKNRELQIMKQLAKQPHPYVVRMQNHFISKGTKPDDVYLNLVLEYIPETAYSVLKHYTRAKESMPILMVKLYMYQLARALAHIHGMGICHRDIKPQNLLVDPGRHILKLCDFGSAKQLIKGEPNVAYICSRYYRAPELIFGSTDYTTIIDVWSQGCVLAELLIGSPIFPGSSGVDQLVEIIKVLGTPTKEELKSMNPNYQEFKFPQIRPHPWSSVFKANTPPDAIDAVAKLLKYVPDSRLQPLEICELPFFDDLRNPTTRTSDGSPLSLDLFTFTEEELASQPEYAAKLTPAYVVSMRENQSAKAAALREFDTTRVDHSNENANDAV
mmetsp:Transcript_12233/g.11068  ORF Transcript_12233/g.11068 Transcript_12233/m.11068 type:complete len:453 (+) Transcript_12233:84-1442(+)